MLKDVQKEVDEVLKPFAKPYWSQLFILARIAEEVGELARLLNHIYGDKPKKPTEAQQELGQEIMDVKWTPFLRHRFHYTRGMLLGKHRRRHPQGRVYTGVVIDPDRAIDLRHQLA